jgi:hypothetical protein
MNSAREGTHPYRFYMSIILYLGTRCSPACLVIYSLVDRHNGESGSESLTLYIALRAPFIHIYTTLMPFLHICTTLTLFLHISTTLTPFLHICTTLTPLETSESAILSLSNRIHWLHLRTLTSTDTSPQPK